MGLVFLVDDGRCRLETVPDVLAFLLGNRAVFLPLLVKFLQFMERAYDIFVLGQLLSRLAERLFGLEILAEVQVTEITVDLDHVIELLDIVLVCIVYVPVGARRYRTRFAPAVLEFAEHRETGAHIVLTFHEGLEFIDDSLLLGEVGLALLVLPAVELRAFLLVVGIHRLEVLLHGLERVVQASRGSVVALEPQKQFIECRLDGLGLLGAHHAVRPGLQFDKKVRKFRKRLAGEILQLVPDSLSLLGHSSAVNKLAGLVRKSLNLVCDLIRYL